jgi:hypothetical protein
MALISPDRVSPAPTPDIGPSLPEARKPTPTSHPHDTSVPTPFAKLVHALGHEADRGEATVRGVLRGAAGGQELSSTDLLALQGGIYRYGETIDLAAKLVDKAGTDIRTVLQGQQ